MPHSRNGRRSKAKHTTHRERRERASFWLSRQHRDVDATFLLAEYNTLRSEVTTSMQIQQQILSFGTATLGIVFAAAFATQGRHFMGILLVVFVPLLCYLILTIWVAENMRMGRAGLYLMQLEKRADDRFDRGALAWESTIFQTRCRDWRAMFEDPDRLRTAAIVTLYFAIAATSILIGWGAEGVELWHRIFAPTALVAAVAVLTAMMIAQRGRVRSLLRPVLMAERTDNPPAHVLRVREQLRAHGYVIAAGSEVFDAELKKIVRDFQEDHHIPADGVVAPLTWDELLLPGTGRKRRRIRHSKGRRSATSSEKSR